MIQSIDDTWSSDLLDMNDYGPRNNRGYRFILVVIDKFSKFGWTFLFKNKCALSITDAFSQIIKTSKRKTNLLETNDGKEFVNKNFNESLTIIILKDNLSIPVKELFLQNDLIEL